MSDVNLVFTVSSVTSAITVGTTTVNVTPNTTAINMFAGYAAYPPNGATGNSQVLFNDAGLFGGVSEFTYNKTSETLEITNLKTYGTSDLGLVGNVKISGGTAGQFLTSSGGGDLAFTTLTPGGNTTELQFNDAGSFAGIPNVTYSGNTLSLGEMTNVKILGGTNGYVLQTDGTGNLTWTAQIAGDPGNGSPSGANTQVQFNDAGLFGGDAVFTYNKDTNQLTAENISGTFTGNISTTTNATFQANVFAQGPLVIQFGKELTGLNNTPATGNLSMNLLDSSTLYKTANATGNYTLNITGNSSTTLNSAMNVGETVTCTFINTNGFPGYYMTQLKIDGANTTPLWIGGVAPSSGETFSRDMYSFNIIKTGSGVYTVLATRGVFS